MVKGYHLVNLSKKYTEVLSTILVLAFFLHLKLCQITSSNSKKLWCICYHILATLGKEGIIELVKGDLMTIRKRHYIFIHRICFVLLYNRGRLHSKTSKLGNSRAAQWLELGTFTAGAQVQYLGGKLRSFKLLGVAKKKKKKKKKKKNLVFPSVSNFSKLLA